MSARRTDNEPGPEDTLDLQAFRQVSPQPGPPLEQLGAALSERLTQGDDPYAPLSAAEPPEAATPGELAAALVANAINEPAAPDPACEITPRTIFEAMLFVGSPDNQPLTSRQVAELMRGVRPAEIDELVGKLNADYEARNCPYRIVSEGTGYRLALADEFAALREQLYGKGRLAQALAGSRRSAGRSRLSPGHHGRRDPPAAGRAQRPDLVATRAAAVGAARAIAQSLVAHRSLPHDRAVLEAVWPGNSR